MTREIPLPSSSPDLGERENDGEHKLDLDATRLIPILLYREKKTTANDDDHGVVVPVRYGVTVSRTGTVADLRLTLSGLCGVPQSRLVVCDVYEHSVYEILQDAGALGNVRVDDVLAAYEVDPYGGDTVHAIVTHIDATGLIVVPTTTPVPEDRDGQEEGRRKDRPFGNPLLVSFDAGLTCRQIWERVWERVPKPAPVAAGRGGGGGDDGRGAPNAIDAEDGAEEDDDGGRSLLRLRIRDGSGNPRTGLFRKRDAESKTGSSTAGRIRDADADAVLPVEGGGGDDGGGSAAAAAAAVVSDDEDETKDENEKNDDVDRENDEDGSYLPRESDAGIADCLGGECTEQFLFLTLEWRRTHDDDGGGGGDVGGEGRRKRKRIVDPRRFESYVDHESLIDGLRERRRLGDLVQRRRIQLQHQHQQRQRGAASARADANAVTLDRCLRAFTSPERLDEQNAWYCSRCRRHVRAMKTMELWHLPNVLVVHLKRFEYKHALRREKLETFVDFPTEGLDMGRYCASYSSSSTAAAGGGGRASASESDSGGGGGGGDGDGSRCFVDDGIPAIYDLFAVTNHYGRMGFGHYTAFARRWNERGMDGGWALFDDGGVRNVGGSDDGGGRGSGLSSHAVVTPAAYMLFYRRRIFS